MRLLRIKRGRPHGALVLIGELVTWKSQTWVVTGDDGDRVFIAREAKLIKVKPEKLAMYWERAS